MTFLSDIAEVLTNSFDKNTALFPTHFKAGFEHDYQVTTDPAKAVRYTALCLEGLIAAHRADFTTDPTPMVNAFRARHVPEPALHTNKGAHGVTAWLHTLPDLQALSWMMDRAPCHRPALLRYINRYHWHPDSLLARHSRLSIRRNIVSFGAMAYFLEAVLEVEDPITRLRALEAVEAIIDTQRPDGGWPWLYQVASGRPVADYPIYTVHQDAMAPMFLLKAHDLGLKRAAPALLRSLRWVSDNRALTCLPFTTYRALTRPGETQFSRGILALTGYRRKDPKTPQIVDGWRSYHLGLLLKVWSPRPDRAEWLSVAGIQQ